MEMDSIKEICVVVFLGVNSWIDIRKRQVSLLLIGIFTVYGLYTVKSQYWMFCYVQEQG